MPNLSRSTAALRLAGDSLVPEEITQLLGCQPSLGYAKGDVIGGVGTGRRYTKKLGLWTLEATEWTPINLDAQASELLNRVTKDLRVWSGIRGRFEIDLFCGLFMKESNEGVSISSDTLRALGERGIELSIEIYSATERENGASP